MVYSINSTGTGSCQHAAVEWSRLVKTKAKDQLKTYTDGAGYPCY
jgi:hypothetical protein